jgi:hypothetical protein
VNTFVNSGITAPASVPHEMMTESVTPQVAAERREQPAFETPNVTAIDRMDADPHEARERRLEVDLVLAGVLRAGDHGIADVGHDRGEDHEHAHHEDPHEERGLDARARTASAMNEISATPVTPYVSKPSAVGPTESPALSPVQSAMTPGLRGIVLLDLEDDLHEVGADVGDLGEDAAGDTERRGAERLADREADEAGAGVARRARTAGCRASCSSSTQISSMPMLMPACSGIA